MFELRENQGEIDCKTLEHSPRIFHEALEDGGKYYHVHNPAGTDYDISYKRNHDYFISGMAEYMKNGELYPDYRRYDEDNSASMRLDFLNQYKRFVCLYVNEYTVAIARAVLRYTDLDVFFEDSRVLWFLDPNPRLYVGSLPEYEEGTMQLAGALGPNFQSPVEGKCSEICAFHSLYTLQWILDGRSIKDVRYLLCTAFKTSGIGAILGMVSRLNDIFRSEGWRVICKDKYLGKYPVKEMSRYFRLDLDAEDSTPENTVEMNNIAALAMSWIYTSVPFVLTTDIFTDKFREDLEEYYQNVIGDKKALGVLIRGTDYIASKLGENRKMATVEQMLPTLREWMARDGYDVIFLATEDQRALEQMRKAFGGRLIAVAQERHSVEEFTDVKVISDLEKKLYSDEEYDERVMDTTINYFYAMYLLSRCDSFIASGQCNGVDMVLSLNKNRFKNYYRFEVGMENK